MNAVRRWRPLLRIAWRDAVRHRARSALVLVLIALPVLAVTAADTLYQTSDISGGEALERRLGGADARISVNDYTSRVLQEPDPDRGYGSEGGESETAPTIDEVSAALGRPLRAIEWRSGEVRVETDRGVSPVEVSEIDLRDPLARGLVTVEEGRLPIAADEVFVNGDLASRGPDLGETLQVLDGRALRVVGVGESTSVIGRPLLFALPDAAMPEPPTGLSTWLVDAGAPVTWGEVLDLNEVGATVLSREVLVHPPSDSEIPAEVRQMAAGGSSEGLAVVGLVVAMVLLEVVLLAGPAFAVGARRQSRNLALMSATGGTPPQARRTILALGLVLGTLGAVVGVVAGLVVAWATAPLLQRLTSTVVGPFDVPWLHLVGVALFGLVSALLAAVVPAWIASQQDVVAVLAGRRGDRKAGLRSPLAGLVLLGVGVAGSAYGARASGNGELMIAFSAILAVLGMILLVPVLLVALARVSGRLPLALRFAVRDAARHRTRTVPAVAAVAATVAGVVALGIANASDARQSRETYIPTLAAGDGVVAGYDAREEDWPALRGVLAREVPDATVREVRGVPESGSAGAVTLQFAASDSRDFLYSYGGSLGASVLVATRLPALPTLTSDQLEVADRALADGRAVVFANEPVDGDVATVWGERYDAEGAVGRVPRRTVPAEFLEVGTDAAVPLAVLPPALAERLDVPVATVGLYLTGAEISPDQQRNASEAVAAIVPYASLYVERGYEGDDATRILLLILGALGGVLMLGGTLTATYLALSDARPDLATLGAVGAAPRTRRAVAGSFAVVVGLVGAVVGAVVGFIPGIAVAFPLTTSGETITVEGSGGINVETLSQSGPYLAVPWPLIGTLVVALPLLTALVVSVTTRSRLPLVARLD